MIEIRHAIRATAAGYADGSTEGLAKAIGRTVKTFQNQCTPSQEDHWINVRDLVKMIEVSGDPQVLHAIADKLGYRCLRKLKNPVPSKDLNDALFRTAEEEAETTQAIQELRATGRASAHQIRKIRTEIIQDYEAKLAMLDRLIEEYR